MDELLLINTANKFSKDSEFHRCVEAIFQTDDLDKARARIELSRSLQFGWDEQFDTRVSAMKKPDDIGPNSEDDGIPPALSNAQIQRILNQHAKSLNRLQRQGASKPTIYQVNISLYDSEKEVEKAGLSKDLKTFVLTVLAGLTVLGLGPVILSGDGDDPPKDHTHHLFEGAHFVSLRNPDSHLNVRSSPGFGENEIGELPNGTIVWVKQSHGAWNEIECDGLPGVKDGDVACYVSSEYLSPVLKDTKKTGL